MKVLEKRNIAWFSRFSWNLYNVRTIRYGEEFKDKLFSHDFFEKPFEYFFDISVTWNDLKTAKTVKKIVFLLAFGAVFVTFYACFPKCCYPQNFETKLWLEKTF